MCVRWSVCELVCLCVYVYIEGSSIEGSVYRYMLMFVYIGSKVMCDLDKRAFFGRAAMIGVAAFEVGTVASSTTVLKGVTPFTRVNPLLIVKSSFGRVSTVVQYGFVDECLISRRKFNFQWLKYSLGLMYLNQGLIKSVIGLGNRGLLSLYGMGV